MEPFKEPKDVLTRKYVNEAGLDQVPRGTYEAIMQQIEALNAYSIKYRPLISRKGWVLICAFVILFCVGIFWVPIERFYMTNLPSLENNAVVQTLSEFSLSSVTLYAIGFLGLFLIQLPFLKRILDRQQS